MREIASNIGSDAGLLLRETGEYLIGRERLLSARNDISDTVERRVQTRDRIIYCTGSVLF
jgi:hypothetical protein